MRRLSPRPITRRSRSPTWSWASSRTARWCRRPKSPRSSRMQTLQLLLSGLAQGMIYALLAFGYNITFSTSKTLNFALGNFLMIGGVLSVVLYGTHHLPFLATLGGVMAAGAVGGIVVKKTPLYPSTHTHASSPPHLS